MHHALTRSLLATALECKKKLVHTDAVKVFVKDPNSFDDIILPAPLTVFGIKTTRTAAALTTPNSSGCRRKTPPGQPG